MISAKQYKIQKAVFENMDMSKEAAHHRLLISGILTGPYYWNENTKTN